MKTQYLYVKKRKPFGMRSDYVQITFKLRSEAFKLRKNYVKIAQKRGVPKGSLLHTKVFCETCGFSYNRKHHRVVQLYNLMQILEQNSVFLGLQDLPHCFNVVEKDSIMSALYSFLLGVWVFFDVFCKSILPLMFQRSCCFKSWQFWVEAIWSSIV